MLIFSAVTPFLVPAAITDHLPVAVDTAAVPRVMEALGFTTADPDGRRHRECPYSFLGRALLAQALAPFDVGLPATRAADDALMTAGISKGYLQTRLMPLGDLARYCMEHELLVAWDIAS